MKMIFATEKNEVATDRFAPCATDRLLLKTLSVNAKRAVAQKVLLIGRGLDNRPVLSNLHHRGFKRNLMNTKTLKSQEVLRGKTSGQETQQSNLTKGRNQRQIHE